MGRGSRDRGGGPFGSGQQQPRDRHRAGADALAADDLERPPPGASPVPQLARKPSGRDHREFPTVEVFIRDSQPIGRVCGMGLCVEDPSGTRA